MALKIPVVDRIPTYPGRVQLTPVDESNYIYDLVRADQPIEEGTPINKELFDTKADGVAESSTVYVATTGSDTGGDGTSGAPYATIQKAIDSVPKVLNGKHVTINIAEGTYAERVQVDGFSGGRLTLGVAGVAVTVNGISVWSSSFVRINISNITYSSTFPGTLLYCGANSEVHLLSGIELKGSGSVATGIGLEQGSILTTGSVAVTVAGTTSAAVQANTGARAVFYRIAGSENTGNALKADNGGVITYDVRTLEGTTLFATNSGGRIYRGAQTNAPEY